MDLSDRCCESVYGDWHSHRCSRKGIVLREGKKYCKQHDPELVKEKDDRRNEKWNHERAVNQRKWHWQKNGEALWEELRDWITTHPKKLSQIKDMIEKYEHKESEPLFKVRGDGPSFEDGV